MSRGHLSHADILSTFTDDALERSLKNTEAALARSEERGDRWHKRTGLDVLRMLVDEKKRRQERAA